MQLNLCSGLSHLGKVFQNKLSCEPLLNPLRWMAILYRM